LAHAPRGTLTTRARRRSSVQGIATPDGDAQPTLIEIFRIEDGRLAETWGISEGPDPRRS
jgi:predicted SnoaL-like aldol condensation-catalyzing enzyme